MQLLLETMRRLRAPDGCPWDKEQTHQSLRPYLLEEAAEAVDAIQSADTQAITEELGDVLLQIAFHAVIAEESKSFAYADIEKGIVDKLIRRHPHVFADSQVANAEEVVKNWQAIKAGEKSSGKQLSDVPHSLPALMRAAELGKKRVWETCSKEALLEKMATLEPNSASIGALLIDIVGFAQASGINAEIALRDALLERSS